MPERYIDRFRASQKRHQITLGQVAIIHELLDFMRVNLDSIDGEDWLRLREHIEDVYKISMSQINKWLNEAR
jgi:hypothetical protein